MVKANKPLNNAIPAIIFLLVFIFFSLPIVLTQQYRNVSAMQCELEYADLGGIPRAYEGRLAVGDVSARKKEFSDRVSKNHAPVQRSFCQIRKVFTRLS